MLTNYNGNDVIYDEIGNPVTFGSTELTWLGRQLMQMKNDDEEVSYAYNGDGQRVSKTYNGTTTEYFYNGEILAGQKTGDDVIVFMYDNNSDAFGFIYNEKEYYYVKNAQNDIIAIADADGTVIANYYYDAWGYPEDITGNTEIANLNPLRYRSYYYDTENELYYLNTRYYSAEIGRFISSDGYIQTGQGILDKNMFAYCENNSVNRIDLNGKFWGIVVGVVLTGVLAVALTGCSSKSAKSEPYQSADDAARAFANSTYSSSRYIRHEYATEIYSRTINGKTTYNYNPPRSGKPHSVSVGYSTPKGTKIVAYAHTYPNSNSISAKDISNAQKLNIDAYVVGPNLELQHYNTSLGVKFCLGQINPVELTKTQKNQLVSDFKCHVKGISQRDVILDVQIWLGQHH